MSNNRLNGQSTPYTLIRRNMYLTKKVKRRLEDDGIFCSCSSTPETSAVCGEDCLCGLLMSSCSSGCKCGSSCLNKPFHQRQVKKMKLVKTEKCGSGIVADEDIKRGEFVIEYVGEVIDDKICEERLWKMKHSGETNFYLCEINRDMVIDATYKGNKSRYINHSCCPNTEMQKWMIDGETRIGTFSTRDIKRGEHLTYDYQFVQFGADQDCHCGSVGCRRKLGVKSNKPKLSASDAALKIVACHLAATSPKLKAPLSTNRIEKMENLLKQSGEQVFDQEFCKKLAQVFSFSKGHAGKPIVKWTEVQTWFQNRLKSCLSKDNLAEANRKLPDVTEECALDKANQRFHMPEGKKVPDLSDLEFEARSSEDGAWYDVDTFISHRFSSGELEVLVRYVGFGPEEDEWINVGKSVRERSVALENSECSKVRVGDTVLCFQERKDHARYVDARILEIQKKFYDLRGCRCLFVIQYDHDNTEETVHLRRLCFRPSILGRLSQI